MAELGVVLLECDPLCLQRGDEVVDVVLRCRRADGREAQGGVDGDIGAVDSVASENSFSNAARSVTSCASSAASIRLRNERWQTPAGAPSRVMWSVRTAPVCGA
ncbi:MAG TPA: hypothetical protein VHR88_04720 [Solirubrobacteraceae bacterium]|nr:hypothetical protein [Solirubrobacteraceae bacterium]